VIKKYWNFTREWVGRIRFRKISQFPLWLICRNLCRSSRKYLQKFSAMAGYSAALQLPSNWQDAIEARHEALSPGGLRLFFQDDLLAIIHATPAKLALFVEKYFPRLCVLFGLHHVRNFRCNFRRADDDAKFRIDVRRAGVKVE
jgi:hypothetical protein